eukprot:1161925-Pelagomonas_calceolata.AAC.17
MQMHHAHAQQFEVISMRCNRSHALQKRPAQGTGVTTACLPQGVMTACLPQGVMTACLPQGVMTACLSQGVMTACLPLFGGTDLASRKPLFGGAVLALCQVNLNSMLHKSLSLVEQPLPRAKRALTHSQNSLWWLVLENPCPVFPFVILCFVVPAGALSVHCLPFLAMLSPFAAATGKSAIAGALQPSHAHSTHPVQLKVLSSDSMKVGWCCWNCMKLLKVQAVALRWDSAALRATA